MQVSPGGSGRVFLFVVLLLVACYIADWTDDDYSSSTYNQYSTFQVANGRQLPISGGGNMDASRMMAFALGASARDNQPASAVEAVFGAPMGAAQGTSADASQSRVASARGLLGQLSSDGMDRGTSNYGFGQSNNRPGSGLSGSSAGLALSGSGSGLNGSSGLGASTSIFAGPQ